MGFLFIIVYQITHHKMYRLQPIQDAMLPRVGFRQTTNPQLPQLVNQITESDSGIFIQDRHPLLNTNNLYMASENFDQYPWPEWILPVFPALGYDEDVYVTHGGIVYVSDVDANYDEPDIVPASWTVVENFSQYLLRIMLNASQQTIEKVFQYKKVNRNTKTIFENIHLFDGAAGRNSLVIKQSRFVGFRIKLQKQKHLTLLLRKIGTQFNGVTGPFNFYVYHESVQTPLLVIPVNHTAPNSFQWHNIDDIVLPYVSDTQDAGGVFFIGYYEDDIATGVQAITRNDYKWDSGPCAVCGSAQSDRIYHQKWSAFSNFIPVMVNSGFIQPSPDRNLFPVFSAGLTYDNNWGINFHITLKCDVTDFILENVELLDEAYSNEIAYQLLNSMSYTLRDNGDAKQLRDKAVYEMTRVDSTGISKKMDASYTALDFDLSGFNSVCLPDTGRGARTGSMI